MAGLHAHRRSTAPAPARGTQYVQLLNCSVLLPTLPASARTIACYVLIPTDAAPGAYLLDNRGRADGSGAGYFGVPGVQGIAASVGTTAETSSLSVVRSGTWTRVFLEYAAYTAPTLFGRYSWGAAGAGGQFTATIAVAEIVVFDHLLTAAEKGATAFPANGVLARYTFQTTTSTTTTGTYPLPDVSGNGLTAQLGVAVSSSRVTVVS